jgi:hypothetical protein
MESLKGFASEIPQGKHRQTRTLLTPASLEHQITEGDYFFIKSGDADWMKERSLRESSGCMFGISVIHFR